MSLNHLPAYVRPPLWRAHGEGIPHRVNGDPADTPQGPVIDVYSYYAPGVSRRPFVLLAATPTPAHDFWHLTPASARDLAALILEAAESAEAEQVALGAATSQGL